MRSRFRLILCLFTLLFTSTAWSEQSLLISPPQLEAQLNTLRIIDLRAPNKYQAGHIPHAINIPFAKFNRTKNGVEGFVISPQQFQTLMEQHGIKNSDAVALYSDWAYLEAARIYWVFDLYGHHKIQVLNGGIQAWKKQKRPLETATNTLPPSHYLVEIHPQKLATKLQTLIAAKASPNFVLVDARPVDQYEGKTSLTDRKGHIPNAINLPWYDLVQNRDAQDGYDHEDKPTKMVDWQQLQQKLNQLTQLPKDKKIIVYCNGGMESSILYMALKQLNRDASLYDGSWFEWSKDLSLPVKNPSQEKP